MDFKELKEFLDFKAEQYENPIFLESDPIQLPHRFSKKEDIEIVGFMANKKLESVRIDGEIIEIYKGDFFVGSFDDIEEHLNENSVRLI